MLLKVVMNIKLNIFFPSKIDRIDFLKENFNIEYIDGDNEQALPPVIGGLTSFKFKNSFKKIPGYWLELLFSKDQKGKELYNDLIEKLPNNKRDRRVFYPTTSLSARQLQFGWINKYNFSIKDQHEDKWNLFYKELKKHMKYERIDIVYVGLNLLLKYNPFFLKKYKRYYLFEELAYYYEEQGNITKAIKCLRLQSMLNPKSVEPYLNMSSFYIINGMEEDAIQICRAGLKKYPDDQYLISNLIIALSSIGNYNSALLFLSETLENDKKNILLWKLMGDLYYEVENNEKAIECYKKALSIENENVEDMTSFYADVYNAIGACYFEEKNMMMQ